jgi:hypothetical protein
MAQTQTTTKRVTFKPEKSLTTIVHISPRQVDSDSDSDQETDHTGHVVSSRPLPSPAPPLTLPLGLRFSTYFYKEGTLLSSEYSLKAGTGNGVEPVIRQLPALLQQDNRRVTSASSSSSRYLSPWTSINNSNKHLDTSVHSQLFTAHQRPAMSARQRNIAGIFGAANSYPGSFGQASLQLQNFRHVPFIFKDSARLRSKPTHLLRTAHQETASDSLITAHKPSTPKTFTSIYRLSSAK